MNKIGDKMPRDFADRQVSSFGSKQNGGVPKLNVLDAIKLLGGSNRCVIKLDSTEYILRLTKQHKLILTK